MATTKKAPVKKVAPSKKVNVPAWNNIHIFGYGETQLFGKTRNGKVSNTELKALDPLFTALAKKQQKGTKVSLKDTHVLNIFNGLFFDFHPRPGKNKSQRFAWSDVNKKLVDNLVKELINKVPEQIPRKIILGIPRKDQVTGTSLRHSRSKKAAKRISSKLE